MESLGQFGIGQYAFMKTVARYNKDPCYNPFRKRWPLQFNRDARKCESSTRVWYALWAQINHKRG